MYHWSALRVGQERQAYKLCRLGLRRYRRRVSPLTSLRGISRKLISLSRSAKIENTILCNNVRIGEKAQIKDCELGAEYEVEAGADLKGERLTAGEEA
jgi:translation initiation factor eIF-2B subunit gamma